MALIGDMEYLEIGSNSYRIADNQALHSVPVADANTVGGVKAGGSGITIAADGTISAVSGSDELVKQSPSTANSNLRVLLSHDANDTEATNFAYKSANLKFNPSSGTLTATTLVGAISSSQVTTALGFTPAEQSHTHGNIQNGGTLQTSDVTIATGDKLVVTDASDSNKVARTSISFDTGTGSTAKYLSQAGTWVNIPQGTAYTAGSG